MNPSFPRLMSVIAIVALAGIAVSSVSLQHHYAKSKTEFCDIGEAFNCDLVNRSIYSEILGIPVALIGILGYAVLAGLAMFHRKKAETPLILLACSVVGLAFALRLTYIEARILGVWCLLCLSSLAVITTLTLLSLTLWVKSRNV